MNIQFNIDWHGHLDISQYVREAEPKQRNADVRSAIYGRTDQNKIELYLDDDAEYAPLVISPAFVIIILNMRSNPADCIYTAQILSRINPSPSRLADHILHVRRSGYYPDVEISASYLF